MVQRKVDYKPFAPHNDSNLVSQETWENASTVEMGFVEGKASAKMVNKALRQATSISASFAEMIAKYADVDVLDDGNTLKLAEDFKTSIFNIAQMTMQENVLDQKYAKRIQMDVYANYQNIVILLCKAAPVVANPTGDGKVYSSIAGKLSFFRGHVSSSTRLEQLNIAVHTAYRSSIFNSCNKLAMSHESKSWDFRFATCTYEGEQWIVLKNTVSNVQNFLGDFNGVLRFNDSTEKQSFLKVIPYYEMAHDSVAAKVLNQEIYDSLTEVAAEDIQKMTDATGGEYYTSANKPTPSDLGAMYKELPLPDFHAPLNDDLKILHGFGNYDTIEINEHVIDLLTKVFNYSRDSKASYTSKYGTVCQAEVNEPRFETLGVFLEDESDNLIEFHNFPNNLAGWQTPNSTGNVYDYVDAPDLSKTALKASFVGDGINRRINGFVAGETYTFSFWAKNDNPIDVTYGIRMGGTAPAIDLNILKNTDWQRYSVTTQYIGGDTTLRLYTGFKNTPICFWGMQLEKRSKPSSLIYTSGAQERRRRDYLYVNHPDNLPGPNKDFTIAFESDLENTTVLTNPCFVGVSRSDAVTSDNTRVTVETNGSISFWAGCKMTNNNYLTGKRNIVVISRKGSQASCCVNGVVVKGTAAYSTEGYKISLQTGHVRNLRVWHQGFDEEQLKWVR